MEKKPKQKFLILCTSLALVFLLISLFVQPVFAVAKIISTVDSSEITFGEEFTLNVAISDPNLSGLNFPQRTPDYEVVATSTSTSFQIINGVSSSNKTISFVIRPMHPGRIVLPPVSMNDGANFYSTDSITVNVLPAAGQASRPIPAPGAIPPGFRNSVTDPGNSAAPPRPVTSEAVFARIEVDNLSPYVNQQVTAKLKIYHRGNLRSINVHPLKLEQFIQKRNNKHKEYTETYKGIEYLVYEINYAVFPVKSGLLTIPKLDFEGIVMEQRALSPRNFDPFRILSQMFVEREVKITAPSITLNVRELPAGAPKDFSGYVGQLDLVDILKPSSLKTGESATLTTQISGDGNFRNLDFDRLRSLKIFNVYKDKEKIAENFAASWLGFAGEVNYALIPTKAKGKLKVDLKPVAIFNPRSGRYEERGNSSFELDIVFDPSVKVVEQEGFKAKDKIDKSMLKFSRKQITAYIANPLYNENVLFILVLIINALYALFYLSGLTKNTKPDNNAEQYSKEFGHLVKSIKSADNIADISKAVKDLVLGNEARINNQELKITLNQFLSETDMLNYSNQASQVTTEKLAELKTKALSLIQIISKEIKRSKEVKKEKVANARD